jgi:ABC-type Mn2+/Zn2+ transport system ATPase subunit
VGTVGSGKSSLLLAILGELWAVNSFSDDEIRSFTSVHGFVAYVAQDASIQNATIRVRMFVLVESSKVSGILQWTFLRMLHYNVY